MSTKRKHHPLDVDLALELRKRVSEGQRPNEILVYIGDYLGNRSNRVGCFAALCCAFDVDMGIVNRIGRWTGFGFTDGDMSDDELNDLLGPILLGCMGPRSENRRIPSRNDEENRKLIVTLSKKWIPDA